MGSKPAVNETLPTPKSSDSSATYNTCWKPDGIKNEDIKVDNKSSKKRMERDRDENLAMNGSFDKTKHQRPSTIESERKSRPEARRSTRTNRLGFLRDDNRCGWVNRLWWCRPCVKVLWRLSVGVPGSLKFKRMVDARSGNVMTQLQPRSTKANKKRCWMTSPYFSGIKEEVAEITRPKVTKSDRPSICRGVR